MSNSTVRLKHFPPPTSELAELDTNSIPLMAPQPGISARLFALLMLAILGAAFAAIGLSAYRAFSDSFIAPLILSPDSDIVIASRLKLDELAHERAQAAADLQGIEAQLTADDKSLKRLRQLQAKFQQAVDWATEITSHRARFGVAELEALNAQGSLAQTMLDEQEALTTKARADMAAGLITRSDYARESQKLTELQRSLIDNRRNVLQGEATMHELQLTARGLRSTTGAPLGPELMASEEQMMRVELEILRIESDQLAKTALRMTTIDRFAKLDELASQLKARPIYQALEHNLTLGFVPYTQIDGVESGAQVYACAWGLFLCTQVGLVTQLVAGEVSLADPWGAPSRGQYAVLNLWDYQAARAKTLRVRLGDRRPLPQHKNSAPKAPAAASESTR